MKKLTQLLCRVLFLLPAIMNTLVVLWLFVYPWLSSPERIDIPPSMMLLVLLFWISGILLCRGKWHGGIFAAAVPVTVYIQNLSGYAGMSHVDWFPIAAVTVVYYVLCGILAYRTSQN